LRANNGVSGPCRRTWLHAPALVVVGAINGLACAQDSRHGVKVLAGSKVDFGLRPQDEIDAG